MVWLRCLSIFEFIIGALEDWEYYVNLCQVNLGLSRDFISHLAWYQQTTKYKQKTRGEKCIL